MFIHIASIVLETTCNYVLGLSKTRPCKVDPSIVHRLCVSDSSSHCLYSSIHLYRGTSKLHRTIFTTRWTLASFLVCQSLVLCATHLQLCIVHVLHFVVKVIHLNWMGGVLHYRQIRPSCSFLLHDMQAKSYSHAMQFEIGIVCVPFSCRYKQLQWWAAVCQEYLQLSDLFGWTRRGNMCVWILQMSKQFNSGTL